ncbi:MAG: hypothetical protein KGI50_07535 [Patescibacteria group bacterium]|nr:hypothetical protein [Patescibacteria group bacterium]
MPVYLRVTVPSASGAENQEALQYGFQMGASGQEVTQDILIYPPPMVKEVPMRDIGLNSAQLSFGSRQFLISHSWVIQRQQAQGYIEPGTGLPDFYRVFRDASVVSLYYNSREFKIVSVIHEDIAGAPWNWNIVANAEEQPVIP